MTNLKKKSKKADLFWLIGMELLETEEKIKEETKATIRCIPFESFVPGDKEPGKCMVTGKPSACRVIFARSY